MQETRGYFEKSSSRKIYDFPDRAYDSAKTEIFESAVAIIISEKLSAKTKRQVAKMTSSGLPYPSNIKVVSLEEFEARFDEFFDLVSLNGASLLVEGKEGRALITPASEEKVGSAPQKGSRK